MTMLVRVNFFFLQNGTDGCASHGGRVGGDINSMME
jgi:hypothetical protein